MGIREATLLLTPILEAEQPSIPETVEGGACSKVSGKHAFTLKDQSGETDLSPRRGAQPPSFCS